MSLASVWDVSQDSEDDFEQVREGEGEDALPDAHGSDDDSDDDSRAAGPRRLGRERVREEGGRGEGAAQPQRAWFSVPPTNTRPSDKPATRPLLGGKPAQWLAVCCAPWAARPLSIPLPRHTHTHRARKRRT